MKRYKQIDLIPFYNFNKKLEISINYTIKNNIIEFEYLLKNSKNILFSKENQSAKRLDNLWKNTCFELFIFTSFDTYWEINLSPSKDWNIYKFNSYRKGMQIEKRIKKVKIQIRNQYAFKLKTRIDFSNIIELSETKLSFTVVVKNKNNEFDYWALKHKDKPDFHSKEILN